MKRGFRGILLWIVTFLAGLYFFMEFILPEKFLQNVGWSQHHDAISNGFVVVGVMAFGLGLINLIRFHGSQLLFQRPGWINSGALLFGLIAALVTTSAVWISNLSISNQSARINTLAMFGDRISKEAVVDNADLPKLRTKLSSLQNALQKTDPIAELSLSEIKNAAEKISGDLKKQNTSVLTKLRTENKNRLMTRLYNIIFDGLFVPLGSAMFALLGVYIGTAAYRAFRVHSVEAGLMMVAAVLVMLGQISFGRMLYEGLPSIRQWLLEIPNAAAFRAVRLGTAVAGLIMAIRMWLSIEPRNSQSDV